MRKIWHAGCVLFSKNSLTRVDSFFFLVQAEMACIDTEEGGCFKGQIGMKGDKRQVINTVMERNQQFFERYIKQQKYSKDTEKNAGPKQTLNKTTLSKQNSS